MLPALLARRLGIEALVDAARAISATGRARRNPGRKVMTLVSAMALGADCIDDCDVLRSGRTAAVLGHRVAAPSTLGTFLRAFTFGHVRQLDRVLAESARARVGGRAPARATSGWWSTSTRSSARSTATPSRAPAFGYTRVRGYHPILATRADTGEVLHIRAAQGLGEHRTRARCASSTS